MEYIKLLLSLIFPCGKSTSMTSSITRTTRKTLALVNRQNLSPETANTALRRGADWYPPCLNCQVWLRSHQKRKHPLPGVRRRARQKKYLGQGATASKKKPKRPSQRSAGGRRRVSLKPSTPVLPVTHLASSSSAERTLVLSLSKTMTTVKTTIAIISATTTTATRSPPP